MPTLRPSSRTPVQTRARWARSSGDMLLGGPINPSETNAVWWMGLDSGGGRYPIGPNGPWPNGAQGQGLPVITRAVELIAGPLTAAPFKVAELGFGGRPLGRPRWITDPMLLRPDSRFADDVFAAAAKHPRGTFYFTWLRDSILFGTGAFLMQEDEQGAPLAGTLKNINPLLLSTERADDGSLRWVIGADGASDEDRVIFGRDGRVTLGGTVTYKIVPLRNPHGITDVDGHTPGVFEQHPNTFRIGGQIDTYTSGTFRSGIPAGYLKVDQTMNSMTQEQADDLKAKWMASHGGDRRSIAVLNAFTSFVPLNLSPVDAALGEVFRLNTASIAFAFGLDPDVLNSGLSNSSTYRNATEFWQRHKDYSLSVWISAVEDTLTALLPGSQGVRVDLDRFANPSPQERFDAYAVAINSGVMTADECRELEGLPPLDRPEPTPVPVPESAPSPVPVETPAPTDIRSRRPAALR